MDRGKLMSYGNITINSPYSISASSHTMDTYSIDTSTGTYNLDNLGMNNITMSGAIGGGVIGGSSSVYTIAGANGTWGGYNTASVNLSKDGIQVTESADIKLGDVSLKDFINKIEQRLALLTPNPTLEKEWSELKELGDRYRELEKHITEKMKTWDILKSED
jgi:hypothetical protein